MEVNLAGWIEEGKIEGDVEKTWRSFLDVLNKLPDKEEGREGEKRQENDVTRNW